jgi:hypothetical protein
MDMDAALGVLGVLIQFPDYFATDSGVVGLKPHIKGIHLNHPELWLLAGCSTPMLLERVEGDSEGIGGLRYSINGEVLVDRVNIRDKVCTVTHGEAWRAAEESDFEWINIV